MGSKRKNITIGNIEGYSRNYAKTDSPIPQLTTLVAQSQLVQTIPFKTIE